MVAAAKRKSRVCGPEVIPNVGSPVENSIAKIFSNNQGGLMVAEDSKDEGGVAGVQYDGLPKLDLWKNPNPSLP